MTHCAAVNLNASGFVPDGCCGSALSSNALNGMATRRTKTMTAELRTDIRPDTRRPWPWASIAVALVAVFSVVAGELWALDAVPATKSEVVTELNSTLAQVVAASVLISPAD
jgi:hypothetical protein